MYQLTTATKKLSKLNKRIRLVPGGTSAGKTISIEQLLIDDAQSDTKPTLTSIVSETFPHLKKGAIRDFKNIMMEHGYWKDDRWNATDSVYTLETGSIIEFFSADQPAKVRGPRRDRLFVNEGNNIPYETWDQLLVRTKEYAWCDWNPTVEFWAYTDVIGQRDDVDVCVLTYKDNEALDPAIVAEIESHKANKNWWKVYGEGQLGEVEGRIFTGWQIVDTVPHEARLEVRGGDFGYARDPTAFCDIYYYNGGYIIDELCYRVNFFDTDLATLLLNQPNPHTLNIVDSADKQKVDVLQNLGVNVMGVEKKGSSGDSFTNAAIGFVQSQRISITKRSTNFIKSYRNFMWQTDRDGNIIPKYDHYLSDGMMAVVYGMTNFDSRRRDTAEQPHVPSWIQQRTQTRGGMM